MTATSSLQVQSSTLPADILSCSPSSRDGIDANEETLHRVLGCELIQEAGILLRTSQVVMVTGQNLLHRFFYRKSLKRFDVFTVAMGCFLLASKVEERPKILREILYVFFHMYHVRKKLKLKPLELGGERYTTWKNEVIVTERFILKELGFSFYRNIEHPHKYLLYYIKVLDGSDALAQRSWNYLNDASRLDLCLRFDTRLIACASIHLAALDLRFPLPGGVRGADGIDGDGDSNCQWWRLFGVEICEVVEVGNIILHLYEMPKVQWLEPIAEVDYLSPEVCAKYDESETAAEEELKQGHMAGEDGPNTRLDGVSVESIDENDEVRKRDRSRSSERNGSSCHRRQRESREDLSRSRLKRSRDRDSRDRSDRDRDRGDGKHTRSNRQRSFSPRREHRRDGIHADRKDRNRNRNRSRDRSTARSRDGGRDSRRYSSRSRSRERRR